MSAYRIAAEAAVPIDLSWSRRLVLWACDREWPVVLVVIAAIVMGFVGVVVGYAPSEMERQDAASERQRRADQWLASNHLEGVATCFVGTTLCDVVPKDARPPFRIDRYGACSVHAEAQR